MNIQQIFLKGRSKEPRSLSSVWSTRLRKLRLLLLRLLWVVVAISNVIIFFVGFPLYYHQLLTTCPGGGECNFGQLVSGNLIALQQLGISLQTYATYMLIVSIICSSIFLVVGLLIFWRKSNEPIAILASIIFIAFGASGDAHGNALVLLPSSLFSAILSFATALSTFLAYVGIGLFFALFPTGRPVPRFAWLLGLLWFIQIIPWTAPPDTPLYIVNWPPIVFALEQLFMWGISISAQVYRYMRISNQIERQQTKWFVYGFSFAILIDVPYYALQSIFPALAAPTSAYQLLSGTVWETFLIVAPIAVGFAIFRYRLWDIDIVINRTLVYGTLTISVIVLYVLVVLGFGSLIQARGSLLLSLLATGLIAVLFQPSRERLQQG